MATLEYISGKEEIVTASWSLFQHDGVAAFKLSERSPLPPVVFVKEVPGGSTQILNDCCIRRINYHPVESEPYRTPECISDMEDCLDWNGGLDILTVREDNCAADIQSDNEQHNGIEVLQCPE
jgi:hypothetical protein